MDKNFLLSLLSSLIAVIYMCSTYCLAGGILPTWMVNDAPSWSTLCTEAIVKGTIA